MAQSHLSHAKLIAAIGWAASRDKRENSHKYFVGFSQSFGSFIFLKLLNIGSKKEDALGHIAFSRKPGIPGSTP
jgi:hypothetical protein